MVAPAGTACEVVRLSDVEAVAAAAFEPMLTGVTTRACAAAAKTPAAASAASTPAIPRTKGHRRNRPSARAQSRSAPNRGTPTAAIVPRPDGTSKPPRGESGPALLL